MNHAEMNRCWWDNVRAGRNPAWKDIRESLVFFSPPCTAWNLKICTFCADYTGTDKDVFEQFTAEVLK
jgi:hypothetical protein